MPTYRNRWLASCSLLGALFLLAVVGAYPTLAAPPPQEGSVYVVQEGDTLGSIALSHGTTAQAIVQANGLSDPNLILVGQRLVIPGAPAQEQPGQRIHLVQAGDTIQALAVRYTVTVQGIVAANGLADPNLIEVGQRLLIPPSIQAEPLQPPFISVSTQPSPVAQGQTLVIRVRLAGQQDAAQQAGETPPLSGNFNGQALFFQYGEQGESWALSGIPAMAETGSYPLILTTHNSAGEAVTATQLVPVVAGSYGVEKIELPADRQSLLDPDLLKAESEKLTKVISVVTPRRLWQGLFTPPLREMKITSFFGTRRSYGDAPPSSFHEGLDLRGGPGDLVYAPAAGRVVLAEKLTVRGNAVVLDHGLGVYTGYWHLSRIDVREGQEVSRGDLLGEVGGTGLATGPHLHWEMRILGITVQPLQWTEQQIP